ncbi:MAG: FAD-dependent oxidoreductase [Gemmatimonadota bacterium]
MSGPRVVVVGGGVVGIACAYYLARGGASVVVLERERLGAGASWGNAGTATPGHPPINKPGRVAKAIRQMIDPTSPLYVHPSWNPGLWRWLLRFARYCTKEHVEHAVSVMAPLGMHSLDLFDELITEERIECEYRREGYYDICATDAGLADALEEAALIRPHGYRPEAVDGDELRRREPALGPHAIGGVFHPEASSMDPAIFLERFARAAERHGVVIREGAEVTAVVIEGGRAKGVQVRGADGNGGAPGTAGAVEPADAVVLATGPTSLAIAKRLGTRLPVQPGKGYHRDIPIGPNGAPKLRIACVLNESAVFCLPMETVVRFAGTMEFSGANRVMRRARLEQLTRAAREHFPKLGPARPLSEWCGLRPMSVDGLPIIGPLRGVEGVSVATGHGMLGLTLAPVTGELIANLVLRGGDERLAALSPERF